MRLDDLQRKARRHRCVEGVASALEDRHPDGGGEPMQYPKMMAINLASSGGQPRLSD
jgi:hypothetical protein